MRRVLTGFTAVIALFGAIAAVVVVDHRRDARPTVGDVVDDLAPRPWSTTRMPAVLPDLSARGWRAMGARVDALGGRRVVTGKYRHGDETLTISRLADTDGLADGAGTWARHVGDVELRWLEGASRLTVRVVAGGHQTVLTGAPGSDALRREMTHVAAALVRAAA